MVKSSVAALQSSSHHVNNDLTLSVDEPKDPTLCQCMEITWDRIANRSVIIRALPRAILAAVMSIVCQVIRDSEYEWFSASIKHPMAVQVFGIMLAFLLTNRVVRAMTRWWDGLMAINSMYNKWYDAFSFLMITIQKEKKILQIQQAQEDISEKEATWIVGRLKQLEVFARQMIHWFSLTNALCLGTLKYGEGNCVSMIKCKPNTSDFPWLKKGAVSQNKSHGKCAMDLLKSTFENGENEPELQYLGDITAGEKALLAEVDDKMYLAVQLMTQALMIANTEQLISIPPSLLNRTYTLIQGGVDAYQNAYKIAAVPYPFPLAQTMDILMAAFVMLMPIIIEKFTASLVLSPLLSFLIAMSYWALNRAAKELENPFGEDANDLPLHDFCASFNDHLVQMSSLQVKEEMNGMFMFSEIFHGKGRMPSERPKKPAPPVAPPPPDRSSSVSGPSIDTAVQSERIHSTSNSDTLVLQQKVSQSQQECGLKDELIQSLRGQMNDKNDLITFVHKLNCLIDKTFSSPAAAPPPKPDPCAASDAVRLDSQGGQHSSRSQEALSSQIPQSSREHFPPSTQIPPEYSSAELYAQVKQNFRIHVPSVYHDMPSPMMHQAPPRSGQDSSPRNVRRPITAPLQGRHVTQHAPQHEFYPNMVPSDAYHYATDPYSNKATDLS